MSWYGLIKDLLRLMTRPRVEVEFRQLKPDEQENDYCHIRANPNFDGNRPGSLGWASLTRVEERSVQQMSG